MLNPIEERKFTELKNKCRELKIAIFPEVFIATKVHDKNGVLVWDDKERAHSWTRNFYNAILCMMSGYTSGGGAGSYAAGTLCGLPTHGTPQVTGWLGKASLGSLSYPQYGIQVGTGDTAAAASDYNLVTAIAHGNESGKLFYQAESEPTPSYDSGTNVWTMTKSRIMNNNSGGSITIKETGLIGMTPASTAYAICYERSVLASSVAVANGAQLTVTYAISMDFSAID